MRQDSWVGVDLDGTLALYHGWNNGEIGPPVPAMMERVKVWLSKGIRIKIMTARAGDPYQISLVKEWLHRHGLPDLEVTNVKDYQMVELWDDRAVGVEPNTGVPLCRSRVFSDVIPLETNYKGR